MSKIRLLPEEVANQIAAGEVVERPASVVKELVENALDAGASRIDIEIEEGGLNRITISDNGSGMTAEDAALAVERHATSKLQQAADLFAISSLGFRGEALPSIASVAKFTLITRTQTADIGVKLEICGGQKQAPTPWGCPPGTSITVSDLFYNTPARRKFLSSPTAEAGRIRDIVARLALAAPSTAFSLSQNGRMVIETPGNGQLKDTLLAIYGREVTDSLLPVEASQAHMRISGYLSRPELTRNNRRDQVFIINGRLIQCRVLGIMLEEAYRSLLPGKRYPLAFLHIELPLDSIDVNVHPAKTEVRFREERQVAALTLQMLRRALQEEAASSPAASLPSQRHSTPLTERTEIPASVSVPISMYDLKAQAPRQQPMGPQLTQRPDAPTTHPISRTASFVAEPAEGSRQELGLQEEATPQLRVPYRLIGQALNSYIVVEREGSLLVVDQHAAHERIIYEELLAKREAPAAQQLLIPYSLSVGPKEAAFLEHSAQELAAFGFDLEPFGGSTYLLRSIPDVYRGRFKPEEFHDLVSELCEGWQKQDSGGLRERLLIRLACQGAIKAGQRLHNAEMIELLDKLWASSLPFTCPHGRPTALSFSEAKLFKLFHP